MKFLSEVDLFMKQFVLPHYLAQSGGCGRVSGLASLGIRETCLTKQANSSETWSKAESLSQVRPVNMWCRMGRECSLNTAQLPKAEQLSQFLWLRDHVSHPFLMERIIKGAWKTDGSPGYSIGAVDSIGYGMALGNLYFWELRVIIFSKKFGKALYFEPPLLTFAPIKFF